MQHRLFKLSHGLSLLGLRPQDLVILFVGFLLGLQVLGGLFPGRLRIVFAAAFIFVTFRAWQGVRDKVPDKFLLHLLGWLSEPDAYRIQPDTHAIPLVVDPQLPPDARETPGTPFRRPRAPQHARAA